uniref:Uncharacterized protein n=1 Tax=Vespula pensylvanica TaxID=30213 RepID=A0A834JMB2_VESPE|nr:hypothetical protein H0235_017772 [Vespula pensylvanica]
MGRRSTPDAVTDTTSRWWLRHQEEKDAVSSENMSSCTDPLHLNEKRLFKELKRSLSGNTKETHNILEIRDDVLYVWNADKCCVQTLNVGATRGKFDEDVTYQGSDSSRAPFNGIAGENGPERFRTLLAGAFISFQWHNVGSAGTLMPRRVAQKSDFFEILFEIRWFVGGQEVGRYNRIKKSGMYVPSAIKFTGSVLHRTRHLSPVFAASARPTAPSLINNPKTMDTVQNTVDLTPLNLGTKSQPLPNPFSTKVPHRRGYVAHGRTNTNIDYPPPNTTNSNTIAGVPTGGNYIATLVDDTVADPSSSDDAGGGATGTTSTAPSSSDSDSKRCRHLYPRDPPAR